MRGKGRGLLSTHAQHAPAKSPRFGPCSEPTGVPAQAPCMLKCCSRPTTSSWLKPPRNNNNFLAAATSSQTKTPFL
eukprot:211478-Chlamydomonas_euryale.AAC.2